MHLHNSFLNFAQLSHYIIIVIWIVRSLIRPNQYNVVIEIEGVKTEQIWITAIGLLSANYVTIFIGFL